MNIPIGVRLAVKSKEERQARRARYLWELLQRPEVELDFKGAKPVLNIPNTPARHE